MMKEEIIKTIKKAMRERKVLWVKAYEDDGSIEPREVEPYSFRPKGAYERFYFYCLLHFKVKYSDSNHKNYEDEFKYDLTIYNGMYFRSFSDIGTMVISGLKDLARTIERVSPDNPSNRLLRGVGTKRCPICDERINNNAKKCRFCSEWIDESVQKEQRGISHDN